MQIYACNTIAIMLLFQLFLLQQIYYIFEVQNVLYRAVIPFVTRKFRQTITEKEMTMRLIASEEKLREFRAKDKAIKDDIKV